jgi:hypothetical protein
MAKQLYMVSYVSAVTGKQTTSASPNKKMADKEAKDLIAEGAKNVTVYPYTPAKFY